MKKEIADQWIAALRSGKYKQTQGRLCKEIDGGDVGYCCLGVLCDLHAHNTTDQGEWSGYCYRSLYGKDGFCQEIPPSIVTEWAGLHADNPEWNTATHHTLAQMNDEGCSFEDIARVIADTWERL